MSRNTPFLSGARVLLLPFIAILFFAAVSCASNAASAEEYFSIGMAYYDLGRFTEAEKWLQRAAAADRTKTASEYNLGRLAFETGRYEEAARRFETILRRDPENVMALKAASYTRIKLGDLPEAEALYSRVLLLVPDSFDDGFNYALVLFALGKFPECEAVLLTYPFALDEKPDALLLLARSQAAANKVEAVDSYAKWFTGNSAANPKVLHEYASVLEKAELFARALEQYRACLGALGSDLPNLSRNQVRFDLARLLLVADPGNTEGLTELAAAVSEGFADIGLLENLASDSRLQAEQRTEVEKILDGLKNPPAPEEPPTGGAAEGEAPVSAAVPPDAQTPAPAQ